MKRISSLITLALFSSMVYAQSPKVIAHRGYWKTEGSAQNSLSALRNAIREGLYGSEFDVLVTSDGVAVVNHDSEIDGVRIEDATYRHIKNTRLPNGEKLPTLADYLKEGVRQNGTKLILELKSHSTLQRNQEAAAIVLQQVRRFKAEDLVEYITFNLDAAEELHRLAPTASVSYLNGELSPTELKALGLSGLDYNQEVIRKHENWIQQARSLGLLTNVWTVNDPSVMREMIDLGVDYITTDEPLQLQKLIKEQK